MDNLFIDLAPQCPKRQENVWNKRGVASERHSLSDVVVCCCLLLGCRFQRTRVWRLQNPGLVLGTRALTLTGRSVPRLSPIGDQGAKLSGTAGEAAAVACQAAATSRVPDTINLEFGTLEKMEQRSMKIEYRTRSNHLEHNNAFILLFDHLLCSFT